IERCIKDENFWSTASAVLFAGAVTLALVGCDVVSSWFSAAPDIKFLEHGEDYHTKPDFAQVEHQYPILPAELAKLSPEMLNQHYDQEQIDQIYARLTAGPIPDGPFDGDLFFPKGSSGEVRLAEIVGGIPGLAVELKSGMLERLGAALWKG